MRDGAIVEALKRTSLPQCQPICRKPGTATEIPARFAGTSVTVPGLPLRYTRYSMH